MLHRRARLLLAAAALVLAAWLGASAVRFVGFMQGYFLGRPGPRPATRSARVA